MLLCRNRFELLSVYGGGSDLSSLYSPSSSTPNLLDYSLPFHLHHALSFSPVLPYADYHTLLSSHLAQLEQSNQWQWAVYLLMSVQHMQRRHRVSVEVERLARGVISRHVQPPKDVRRLAADEAGRVRVRSGGRLADVADQHELWLTNHIGVPRHWFASAHATMAVYCGDYERACTLYIQAGDGALGEVSSGADVAGSRSAAEEFGAAHKLLVQHVAPAYVVAGAVDALAKSYLHPLQSHARSIPGWTEGGGLYVAYHRVKSAFDHGSHADMVREKQALVDVIRAMQRLRQSRMEQRVTGEDTALLVERAALRVMLDECQIWESKVRGGERNDRQEYAMTDRHEQALG